MERSPNVGKRAAARPGPRSRWAPTNVRAEDICYGDVILNAFNRSWLFVTKVEPAPENDVDVLIWTQDRANMDNTNQHRFKWYDLVTVQGHDASS